MTSHFPGLIQALQEKSVSVKLVLRAQTVIRYVQTVIRYVRSQHILRPKQDNQNKLKSPMCEGGEP